MTLTEDRERREFLENLEHGFSNLRGDPKAWDEYQRERCEWDVTLTDRKVG